MRRVVLVGLAACGLAACGGGSPAPARDVRAEFEACMDRVGVRAGVDGAWTLPSGGYVSFAYATRDGRLVALAGTAYGRGEPTAAERAAVTSCEGVVE